MTGLDDARTALERGRHVVLVTPPGVEHAAAVWALAPMPALVVCADAAAAAEWVAAAPPPPAPPALRAHAVTGLGRSAGVLRRHPPDVLAGTPQDLAALVTRSALKLDTIRSVVLAWPEPLLEGEHATALDTLLGELRDVPRIVLSWNPTALADFLERHARRAEIVGALPVDPDGRPLAAVASGRYAIVPPFRRALAVTEWLDAIEAKHPLVWSGGTIAAAPCDAVLCTRLPTREEFQALAALGPVTVLATAVQLPYLRSLASPLTTFPVSGAADRAQDRIDTLRAQVAAILELDSVDAELALLTPLFDRFDPAEVAAALLKLRSRPAADSPQPEPTLPTAQAGRVKIFVTVGKNDRAGPKDLVGALIREVGLDKSAIGKIEVRETFSVVEVAATEAERVIRQLTGMTIRGRRVQARLDRVR